MAKYTQGFFRPLNPQKYKGDPTKIEYRSGWELRCMSMFDTHPGVLEWSSEEKIIPYRSPIDNKLHRYYVDFWIKKKNHSNGLIETLLVEVKPKKQTTPPKIESGKKPTKRYLNEVKTWGVNSAKWAAANKYCEDRGWKFVVITEDEIYGKK